LDREAQKGEHAGSIVADPLFTDPAGGDFSLREDSPALKIGFKPIDMSKVGPRFQACRPASYDDFSKRCKTEHRHTRGILLASLEPVGPFYRSGTPCATTVRLVVENIGDERACGKVRIAAGPAKSAIIAGKACYEFTLAPGRKARAEFTVIPEKTADRIYVEAIAMNSVISSASLHAERLQRKEWKIKRIHPVGSPGLVKKLLADCRPLFANVFHLDCNVAEIRMAASGASLAIHAVIMDKQVKSATPPWDASCLVFFCSTPNSKNVIQLNIQPPKTGKSALATIFNPHSCVPANQIKCVPANEIKSEYSLRPDGYEICALVPFTSLSMEGKPKTFLMEFLLMTALAETGPYQGFGVFEHPCNCSNNAAYGLITIEDKT